MPDEGMPRFLRRPGFTALSLVSNSLGSRPEKPLRQMLEELSYVAEEEESRGLVQTSTLKLWSTQHQHRDFFPKIIRSWGFFPKITFHPSLSLKYSQIHSKKIPIPSNGVCAV